MLRFVRYQLRTTDVPAARAFYADVLGAEIDAAPLPEEAIARGARPHWLGHLGAGDAAEVEAAARAFEARGASRRGPTRPTADGGAIAIVADPGGAIVAVATPPRTPPALDVVWHHLSTTALARVLEVYPALCGWQLGERFAVGAHVLHTFAWEPGGAPAGSFEDITGLAGRHAHWLFHVRVGALEPAIAKVRAAGGLVLEPMIAPDGDRVAVCDDPQGAAFALRAR